MKVFVFFLLVFAVLADDCGFFECGCEKKDGKSVTFNFVSDATRKAVSYVKHAFYLESDDCESSAIYEVETSYALSFLELYGDTTLYNRTLSSNALHLTTEKGISALGCKDVSVGSTINLMSKDEVLKCDKSKITHIIENHSNDEFNITIINVSMINPDNTNQNCTLTNVNDCYVIYPNRGILITMYTCCTVITISVCTYYLTHFNKKTLPIKQPQEVSEVDNKDMQKEEKEGNFTENTPSVIPVESDKSQK